MNNSIIRIRRVGGSLYVRIPFEMVQAFQLKHGDFWVWEPDGRYKFVKQERLTELSEQETQQLEAVC
jgi:antitoxin component of MazEF toxin-antitoxin module